MSQLVSTLHIFVSILLIAVVLLQQGKGADMGATFGGGSNTVFGASGADNLLSKVTRIIAFLFLGSSLFLATHARRGVIDDGALFSGADEPAAVAPVAAPATTPSETPATAPAATAPVEGTEGATPAPAASATEPAPVAESAAPVETAPAVPAPEAPAAAPTANP